ncbi:MAG TPA: PH domain-containing protein [Candidatus Mcinerneyibacterium sp.]|nr:PH domain-containing protein [Candidatus Mcinerneyibacterium sp.]
MIEKKENKNYKILFELKPVFNVFINYLRLLPIILLLISVLILFIKLTKKLEFLNLANTDVLLSLYPMYIAFITLLFVLPLFYLLRLEYIYRNRKYIFTEEFIYYVDGFFSLSYREIEVENVEKIKIEKSIIQRMAKLGTVVIKMDNVEIDFKDIPYIDEVKMKIDNSYDVEIG